MLGLIALISSTEPMPVYFKVIWVLMVINDLRLYFKIEWS